MKKWIRVGLVMLCFLLFGGFLIWFNQDNPTTNQINRKNTYYEKAKVVEVIDENMQDNDDVGYRTGNQTLKVKILSGKFKGKELEATNYVSYTGGIDASVGDTIVVYLAESGEHIVSTVYTDYRFPAVAGFILVFIFIICLIGGKQGVRSILGLAFTFISILFLFIPMLYKGYSPFFASIFIVAITTIVTMLFISGFSCKTLCAIIGTVAGVVVSGISAQLFGLAANISSLNMESAEDLIVISRSTGLQVGGLLFAGILIASLGAVMDVAMSISSTIQEIYDKNPTLTTRELLESGMRVGRDMMGTMSNTLILAFTGGAIPTMLFIMAYNTSFNQFMNTYSIGIEVMQGVAGSLGIVMSVPIVSLIASILIPRVGKAHKKQA